MQNNGKGMSIAGLVLGILAAIAAEASTGIATAGLVLSIIGLILAAIGFISCTLCAVCVAGSAGSVNNALRDLEKDISSAVDEMSRFINITK